MRPALVIFCYAIAVGWVLPLVLVRLSERGVSPRLGLAAWLTAMFSAIASATVALALLARVVIAGWPAFARTVCESVTANTCPPALYRNAAYELGLAAIAFLGGALLIVLGWRYGRSMRRSSVRTRAHAEAARITGHPITDPSVVGHPNMGDPISGHRIADASPAYLLDATRPAVYCVPGRPPTIVLTTGALAVLDPEQLTAVLAHERAHLNGRHHLLLATTRALAAAVPLTPLFTRGTSAIARLAEMRADDIAARHGRRPLLTALQAMASSNAPTASALTPTPTALTPAAAPVPQALPAASLAATGGIVPVRVQRLAHPPSRAQRLRYAVPLAALILAIAAASTLIPALALTGH
jgi:Zn-dependent protease with chaperone function